jgi:hypothetical protein
MAKQSINPPAQSPTLPPNGFIPKLKLLKNGFNCKKIVKNTNGNFYLTYQIEYWKLFSNNIIRCDIIQSQLEISIIHISIHPFKIKV